MTAGAAVGGDDGAGKLTTLQALANAPKPERTYDAITLSLNKRFAKNWLARASYTYSRLIGNYEGLYQAEQNYFAPNGSNAYDTPDLYVNQNGPLPNDRPHLFHARRLLHAPGRQRAASRSACRSRRGRACRATTSRPHPGRPAARHAAAARRGRPHADRDRSSNGKLAYGRAAVARR